MLIPPTSYENIKNNFAQGECAYERTFGRHSLIFLPRPLGDVLNLEKLPELRMQYANRQPEWYELRLPHQDEQTLKQKCSYLIRKCIEAAKEEY